MCIYLQGTYRRPISQGFSWKKVEGRLKQLDVGTDCVFGVNDHDEIYYRSGISSGNPAGTSWVQLPGSLKHISVSPSGAVWGVNNHNEVSWS